MIMHNKLLINIGKFLGYSGIALLSGCYYSPTQPTADKEIAPIHEDAIEFPICYKTKLIKKDQGVELLFGFPFKDNADSFYAYIKWENDTVTERVAFENSFENSQSLEGLGRIVKSVYHDSYADSASGELKRKGEITTTSLKAGIEEKIN